MKKNKKIPNITIQRLRNLLNQYIRFQSKLEIIIDRQYMNSQKIKTVYATVKYRGSCNLSFSDYSFKNMRVESGTFWTDIQMSEYYVIAKLVSSESKG